MSTLNSMLKDQTLNLSKEEFEKIAILRDQALKECQTIGAMIITSCRHYVSRHGIFKIENNA